MNSLDRKTVFTIVAAGIALVLVTVVILISLLTRGEDDQVSPEPEPTGTTSVGDGEVTEPGVTGDPEGENGSEDMYSNDYSNDEGYTKLPTDFDPEVSAPTGTIYDDAYIATTSARLMCEFSSKETITDRALEPVENFYSDLALSGSAQALSTRAELNDFLRKYKNLVGERLSAKDSDDLSMYTCFYYDLDHEHE